jgi:starch phosphorylase
MKAVLNGGLTFSISDGWWDEMKDDEAGWTIPTAHVEDQGERDRLEADALYEILEHEIAPLFHEVDAEGMRHGWLDRVRTSLVRIAPQITAARMVRDYVTELYLPAAGAAEAFADDPALADEFTAWKSRVSDAFDRISVRDVRIEGGRGDDLVPTGAEVALSAAVDLAGLGEHDVDVEALVGPVGEDGEIASPQLIPLRPVGVGGEDRWSASFTLPRPGELGVNVRVVPRHRVLASPAELGLIVTA